MLKKDTLVQKNKLIAAPFRAGKMNVVPPLVDYPRAFRNLDWNHLRAFYFVATIKTFSGASRYLHLSQSALSRVIMNFEKTLGVRLFIRGSRQLTLTRAGEIVYKIATQNFQSIGTLITKLQEDQSEYRGDIHLWAGSGFIHLYLMRYIPDFIQHYPEICLRLSSSKTIPELDLMEADVVIRPPFANRPDLCQIPLLINQVKLYASQPYLKAFGTPKRPQDLDHHRLIAYGKPPGLAGFEGMNWHLKIGRPEGQERKAFIEVDLPEDRLQLAAAGLGITTASREHPGLENYDLVEVLDDFTGPTVPCCYIYSTRLQVSKRVELFRNYLVECFTRDYGPLPSSCL